MNNKDLIKQYVDTAVRLPEYQVMQLSGAYKKTYLRKRMIAHNAGSVTSEISHYEFKLIDDSDKLNFLLKVIKKNGVIRDGWLENTPQPIKNELMRYDIENGVNGNIGDLFNQVPIELKRAFINAQIEKNRQIGDGWVYFMDDNLLDKFIDNEIKIKYKYGQWLSMVNSVFKILPDILKIKILKVCLDTDGIPSAFENDYERLKNEL
jgi:hypothetical protein